MDFFLPRTSFSLCGFTEFSRPGRKADPDRPTPSLFTKGSGKKTRLKASHKVDKKNTAEVIHFVLDADGLDPLADFFMKFSVFVLPAKAHPPVTLQERGIIRKAHASFLASLRLSFFENHRIDENKPVRFRIAFRDVYDRNGS